MTRVVTSSNSVNKHRQNCFDLSHVPVNLFSIYLTIDGCATNNLKQNCCNSIYVSIITIGHTLVYVKMLQHFAHYLLFFRGTNSESTGFRVDVHLEREQR